jgi:hypothetical protein
MEKRLAEPKPVVWLTWDLASETLEDVDGT